MIYDGNFYSRIVEGLHDGLYFVDKNRVILYWNKAAERISGYAAEDVIGRSCADSLLTHVNDKGESLCRGICPLAMTIADGKAREDKVYLHHRDGHRIPVSVRVSPVTDGEGHLIGCAELFTDISDYKSIEMRMKELEAMAFLDNLTRLPNRNYLEKELTIRFEEQKRYGISFGVLMMDIDHFKKFNDTYGHDVGDRVLRYVADTLTRNARPFDIFGRWGGEEFLGIIRNMTPEKLADIGNRLRVLVESAYINLGKERLHVTLSIGASLFEHDDTVDTLLKRADTLLYRSKEAGRNRLSLG